MSFANLTSYEVFVHIAWMNKLFRLQAHASTAEKLLTSSIRTVFLLKEIPLNLLSSHGDTKLWKEKLVWSQF